MIVFDLLGTYQPPGTADVCREYLALTEEQARRMAMLQFESAARTLLQVSARRSTAVELMRHPRRDVRGRAILDCLRQSEHAWALDALQAAAPHALNYQLPPPSSPK